MLARRLIHGTSVSDDAESAMISGLKVVVSFPILIPISKLVVSNTPPNYNECLQTLHLAVISMKSLKNMLLRTI